MDPIHDNYITGTTKLFFFFDEDNPQVEYLYDVSAIDLVDIDSKHQNNMIVCNYDLLLPHY